MTLSQRKRLLKKRVRRNRNIRLLIMVFNLILPVMFMLNFIGVTNNTFEIYSWLWIGFYSAIFSILFIRRNKIILMLAIINIIIILFTLVGSLLVGGEGLLFMIIKMVLPFVPNKWIGIKP